MATKNVNSKNIKDLLIALGLLIGMGVIIFICWSVFFNKDETKTNNSIDVADITGFGSTPQEALTKFIYTAGTMGDYTEVTIEGLTNKTIFQNNAQRRKDSYTAAIEGVVNGSKLIITNQDTYIDKYYNTVQWPIYYSIDSNSIQLSNESESYELKVTSTGETYNAVDIYADFSSTRHLFRLVATDASSDGSYERVDNTENFKGIKFTLVEIADNQWEIYDIDDNGTINSRFSTWNTNSTETYDLTKDEVKDTISPE